MYMYIPLMLDTYPGKACPAISTLVIIFHISNQLGLRCSDPFKSSPGSHSLLVSDSIGTTSSCSVLAFPLSVSLVSSCLHCLTMAWHKSDNCYKKYHDQYINVQATWHIDHGTFCSSYQSYAMPW